jgi:hypothetical protein
LNSHPVAREAYSPAVKGFRILKCGKGKFGDTDVDNNW